MLIENRNGLVVDTELVMASGTAERDAAIEMAGRIEGKKRVTVGADKGYDTRGFVREMRDRNVTPHVSENTIDLAAAPSIKEPPGMPGTR